MEQRPISRTPVGSITEQSGKSVQLTGEVIAFPKNSAGRDLTFGAPSPLPESALRDAHIRSTVYGRRKQG